MVEYNVSTGRYISIQQGYYLFDSLSFECLSVQHYHVLQWTLDFFLPQLFLYAQVFLVLASRI